MRGEMELGHGLHEVLEISYMLMSVTVGRWVALGRGGIRG